MSVIIVISVLVRMLAMIWSLMVLRRLRDRRVLFLTAMLVLMTTRQVLTLADGFSAGSPLILDIPPPLEELPGLMASLMAFLVVLNLEGLVKRGFRGAQSQAAQPTCEVPIPSAPRESEERYRRLVEQSPFCIFEVELDGTLSSVNAAGRTMMGLSTESQVYGVEYLSAVSERDRPQIGTLLEQSSYGKRVISNLKHRTVRYSNHTLSRWQTEPARSRGS